ncbi:MAG: winged helix-turn-helix domain-containing protein, partial [Deltaproteobacteria bacterium]|nr:winged helix-turn-helix domain-containing protein [Deltaproteobacteria bacterium]
MNLLDAAIEVLKDHKRGALSAEDVVRLAVEKKLVQKGGAATVKALAKQLAEEAKGEDGRVAAQDGGYVARKAKAGKKPEAAKAPAGKKAPAAKKPAAPAAAKKSAAPAGKKPGGKKAAPAQAELDLPKDDVEPPAGEPTETEVLLSPDAGFAPAADAELPAPIDEAQDDDDEDAIHERVVADAAAAHAEAEAAVAAALTPEEQELSALYGEELTTQPPVLGEFKDPRTADEDRPMTPEINAREERNKRWEQRRDERRSRRDADRARRHDERGPRPGAGPRPEGEAEAAPRDAAPRDAG